MRSLVRFLSVCALVLIPFIACMDAGGGEEGCDVSLPDCLPIFGECPDPCDGVVCPSDGNPCTTAYCSGGSCYSRPVTDGRSCTYDGLSGVCVEGVCGENLCEDVSCDNGDACNDGTCDYVDGTCDFTPVVCDDYEECTEDTCDPTDGCVFTAVEDGTECGGPHGMCEAGSCVAPCDPASDEEYPCPITGLEDLFCCPRQEYCRDDCFVPECQTGADCDDDNECTENRCDYANGTCYFTPAVCNDGNPCTEDTCDPVDGCIFTAIEDGTGCGTPGWACLGGECVAICVTHDNCDDGNECTDDLCVDGECEETPAEDGTTCANTGICQAGSCTGGTLACSEQGIREAIAMGGGPHTFDCDGPETVLTEAQIIIDNDVILDGEGNLTVDAHATHRVFRVSEDVSAELRGMTITGGATPYSAGGFDNDGTATLTDCTVSANSALVAGGVSNSGMLTLANSTVSGNSAEQDAGGIYNSGTLTLINSTVSDNTSDGHSENNGGGIVNWGTATLTDCTVSGNSAKLGGGFYNVGSGVLTLTNSTVSGNSAEWDGGGIVNFETVTLTNSTVSGNTSGQYSGGILNEFGGAVTLTNSTVSGNSSVWGASIYNCSGCALTATNTVVDGWCMHMYDTPIHSNGYNMESPGNTCGFDPDGTDLVNIPDPMLGPLRDNGGPTETHALLPGSVAIDRIPEADCDVDTDQRGEPRPAGDGCDVGAFEVQP